ncbi:hypothetical protein LR48_Vigan11g055900 [Vigna angularis]|uniref:Retrotransposon gag domain-containing protein n=1 Tax=Phaseolus angularis TaxID=3914 RepID=A0A0L9VR39_PHAAN|nr:hypothetical protein LR48_Vigan11g055900 [Vigna angularis]
MNQSQFWQACEQFKNQSLQQRQQRPSLSGRRITLEEVVQHYIQIPNCHHKSTQAVEEFDRPSPQEWPPPQQWPSPQQWQQQPLLSGNLDSLDNTLQRFLKNSDSIQKSIEESCKKMEMILRYISQRLNVKVNTEVNPKEEGQAIVTESDKILDEKKIGGDEERIERKEKEELSEKNKDEEKEKEVVEREERKKICVKIKKLKRKRKGKKKLREKKKRKFRERKRKKKKMRGKKKKSYEKSHPHLKKNHRKEKKFKCFMEIFKKLEIKVPQIETPQQVPGFIKFLKNFPPKIGVGREHHSLKAFSIYLASPPKISQKEFFKILQIYRSGIAGVDTSAPPFERPRKAINEAYYRQYCGGEEAAQPVPPRRTRAQLQSIHRGQVATTEMIVGMYDTPPAHRWTMEEFHNVVAWPEEQVVHKLYEQMQVIMIVIVILSRMCMSNVNELICEGKPQPPLSGSLPLSGTQKLTLAPLRGEKAAEGRQPTHALIVER